MTTLAQQKNVTPGQVALAWLLHKGQDIVPIPGTKRRKYLDENVAAAEVSLDDAEMAHARRCLAARYHLGSPVPARR